MDPTPANLSEKIRPWVPLAITVAVPLYAIPFGLFGLRVVYPRVLRDLLGGAIAVGMVSLVGLAVAGARVKPAAGKPAQRTRRSAAGATAAKGSRWQLPMTEGMLDEGVAASAVSGH